MSNFNVCRPPLYNGIKARPKTMLEWLSLKMYQFELTLGVYVMTPAEKLAFFAIFTVVIGLAIAATLLYMPQKAVFVVARLLYCLHGQQGLVEQQIGYRLLDTFGGIPPAISMASAMI
jgi:hypothetical protein